MIISALSQYYNILSDYSADIPQFGYSVARISFALNLSMKGNLVGIFDLRNQDKKSPMSIEMIVPEQAKRSGQKPPPYFLSDKTEYVLGIGSKKAEERFVSFKKLHQKILKEIDDPSAKAILNFLEKWKPNHSFNHPILKPFLDDILKGVNFVFRLDGEKGNIHERKKIKRVWEAYCEKDEKQIIAQCMVSGEFLPIARLHQNLKGIVGAQSSGVPLVTVNCESFESYGKKQSYNSPISKKITFKYTTSLNYLLSSRDQKIRLGDTTTVYWAESSDTIYSQIVSALFAGSPNEDDQKESNNRTKGTKTEEIIKNIFQYLSLGMQVDYKQIGIDKETLFCILGLSPNAGRVSVRFYYQNSFGKLIDKIIQHYKDLRIVKRVYEPEQLPLYRIINELAPPVGKEKKVPQNLVGCLMRSIITGSAYPTSVFQTLLCRIRADQDDNEKNIQKKITYPRVAMIKAYLARHTRIYNKTNLKEVLSVGLNEESTNVAYRLGRVFALLEMAQKRALGNEINATIKDRFFSSACAAPRTVFPTLLRLGQHHLSKMDKSVWLDSKIENVLNEIDIFPSHLNLEEQGLFVLGYYQQRHALYQKKENN